MIDTRRAYHMVVIRLQDELAWLQRSQRYHIEASCPGNCACDVCDDFENDINACQEELQQEYGRGLGYYGK